MGPEPSVDEVNDTVARIARDTDLAAVRRARRHRSRRWSSASA